MAQQLSQNGQIEAEAITPYAMHVSQRYLELTKKKLELTRLPRELELPDNRKWENGTPKSVLEPLLDFWLEGYDWRAAESSFNNQLPQFRTTISIPSTSSSTPSNNTSTPQKSLRLHFVHKPSKHPTAIPLLICHDWPSSFIEITKIIDSLTDPQSLPGYGEGAGQAFHVVCPSVPGFGFSDASAESGFGVRETASVFDGVMRRLGYGGYVVHGVGWGFQVCRALAMQYPTRCLAVHTANPSFPAPTSKMARLKYAVARLTCGKFPALSFGYTPSELEAASQPFVEQDGNRSTLHRLYSLRPQTLSFSLCDSPVGLLAALLDIIHTRGPSNEAETSRSRSPFLSPEELETRDAQRGTSESNGRREREEVDGNKDGRSYTWTPTEMLNWTMMQWLPGPESSLRWLRQAHLDTTASNWNYYCAVPLGISSFRAGNSTKSTPLMWGSTSWNMGWVKRHQRSGTLPAWEAPDQLVLDLRECFGTFLAHGKLANLPHAATSHAAAI